MASSSKFWLQRHELSGEIETSMVQGLVPSIHATLKCVPPSQVLLPMAMAPFTTGRAVAARSRTSWVTELVNRILDDKMLFLVGYLVDSIKSQFL